MLIEIILIITNHHNTTHRPVSMQKIFINSFDQLNSFCDSVKHSPWLAVDTEFLRENTYYPVFCLLQVSNGELSACIDPLQIDDLSPIKALLFDANILKIFHAAFQDMEIFFHEWGDVPSPIFDTQLAATITGHGDQLGYGRLVEKTLKITLEKDQSRTDWSMRPLDEKQLDYAHADVIYLGQVYQKLSGQLQASGRSDWLENEYQRFHSADTYNINPKAIWQKVKGRQHLKGVQLAVLQSLAAWREEYAIKSNKPRRWILKDEVLIDLSRRTPSRIQQLDKIRGLEKGTIKKNGHHLLELIRTAKQQPKEEWPTENNRPIRLNPQQEALADLLTCCLRLAATENDITPSALASRKDLEKLVAGIDGIPLLEGWRYKVAGKLLQDVINKKLLPGWDRNGKLTLIQE